jgi:hypothetical protein
MASSNAQQLPPAGSPRSSGALLIADFVVLPLDPMAVLRSVDPSTLSIDSSFVTVIRVRSNTVVFAI